MAAVASAYYAVEHLLTTQTPTSDFDSCDADGCTDLLATRQADVVIGPYDPFIRSNLPSSVPSNRYATLLEARERAIAKHGVPMYVTGDELSDDRIFSFYLVYRKVDFKHTDFVQRVSEAISSTRAELMVEIEGANLPMSKRGVRRSKDRAIPELAFFLPVVVIILGYAMVQVASIRRNQKRQRRAQDLKEGVRVTHATCGEGVIRGALVQAGEPRGVQGEACMQGEALGVRDTTSQVEMSGLDQNNIPSHHQPAPLQPGPIKWALDLQFSATKDTGKGSHPHIAYI